MQTTRIEWVRNQDGSQGYTSNPVKGFCPMTCRDNQGREYCYARALYQRFGWLKTIRFEPEEMAEWAKAPPGSTIFVGSTIELFGEWVPDDWMKHIFDSVRLYPAVTFQFLTKKPENLLKFSPFPPNAWVGITATDRWQYSSGISALSKIEAKLKFISFEPLLNRIEVWDHGDNWRAVGIDWVIIGLQTPYNQKAAPRIEWIEEIISACDEARVKVFLKDNLWLSVPGSWYTVRLWLDKKSRLRQEMPAHE